MKHEQEHKESRNWFVPVLAFMFLIYVCIYLSGCGMVKGLAHDAAWTFDKIDQSLSVPEQQGYGTVCLYRKQAAIVTFNLRNGKMDLDKTRRLYAEIMESHQQQEWCINCSWWKCAGKIHGENIPYEFGHCFYLPPILHHKTKNISKSYEEYSTIVSDGCGSTRPITNHDDFCSLFHQQP